MEWFSIYPQRVITFNIFLESGFSNKVLVDGKLTNKIRQEESLWSLEPSKCITITLEKTKQIWWTAILEGIF